MFNWGKQGLGGDEQEKKSAKVNVAGGTTGGVIV